MNRYSNYTIILKKFNFLGSFFHSGGEMKGKKRTKYERNTKEMRRIPMQSLTDFFCRAQYDIITENGHRRADCNACPNSHKENTEK